MTRAGASQGLLPDRIPVLVLAILLVFSFAGLGRGLWTPDEPREAEISREMFLHPGVLPTLNGVVFAEKPPLYYWLVAAVFRVAGGPSAAAARAVSGAAGFMTLLLVYAWGWRAHSTLAGVSAAVMLATSLQFLLSTHWVLMDSLLMLFVTAAAWAAWELFRGAGAGAALLLYGFASLALWTKGLVGPALLGAGLGAWCLLNRSWPWQTLRLGIGILVMVAAVGALALAIYLAGGFEALREWAWVNHVLRVVRPQGTGHVQPVAYYLWTVPFAVLPWLVPLANVLRPATWRESGPGSELPRYCAILAGAMVVLLSAAATKRGTYLLPALPLLFLAFGAQVANWQRARLAAPGDGPGFAWGVQAALLGLFALVPPVAALVYLRRPDPVAVAFVILAAGACGMLVRTRRDAARNLVALAACALAATGSLLVLLPRVLNDAKDMAPFVAWIGRQLPDRAPVYALWPDETLLGIVPFVTERRVVVLDPATDFAEPRGDLSLPEFVLIQSKNRRPDPPGLARSYAVMGTRDYGEERRFSLWRRRAGQTPR
jgi:4-amino-4-deoxy-L-arabinose transferase-like glycosyltransferase